MKLFTTILAVVLCSAVAVTAQAPGSQQTPDIEVPEAQPSIDVLREKVTCQATKYYGRQASWLRDLLDADIRYPSADPYKHYGQILEDFEKLERTFTPYTTDEMKGLGRRGSSEEDVKRTALLRDGKPFESTPANEGTDAPSSRDLLGADTDWPSADEDEDESYAEFLSSSWEYAENIRALRDTDRMYVVEAPEKTGVSSEGSNRYWLYTYDGRRYGPYDNKAQVEFAL
ncbi:hypothetical protein J4E86_004685 [Alternaria arbusti]|uniref:uncharacterized protein n=1 Tax=Alternaria arbusti TaxID=232088 RepID=UPI002220D105|nr:uncharacterized protein J4E86_004685 [Alternaria arbusti]KAI4957547.1 hypothetical protein J4E86_004685 [Alternaria arbusti]